MIQTDTSSIGYFGNNSIVTPYPVPFYFFAELDLVVIVKDVTGVEDLQILGTDYTVEGEGNPNGGSITMKWAVPTTSTVTISRDIPATQLTSYEEADAFPAKSHERALDKLTMLVQQALRITGSGGGSPSDLALAFRLSQASGGINAVAKLNDSSLGLDAFGNAILRSPGEMLGWLGQVGTAWANTAERLVTVATFPGQLGVQIDNSTIYIAHSTTPGDWFPFLIGTGIIAATDGVPHLLTPPAGDLVGTEAAQILYNKTLVAPAIQAPTGITKNDVGLSQVDNTSDLNKPLSTATGAALAFKQDRDEKGISNGYPSLDGAGKIPTIQLPDSVVGASQYQGTWDAATNTPTIPAAAIGNKGWYYAVSVAGTTNINGISSWAVGDEIISNGSVWQKIPNVSAVSSVNAKTGAVVLVKGDIGLTNVDDTSDAQKNAASATLTNKTIDGANNTLNVRLGTNDVSGNLPVTRLNAGTGAANDTFWRGDGTWSRPTGTGDVLGPNGSGDGEVTLYSGTTGKIIRRYSGPAGVGHFTATGVFSASKIMAVDLDPDAIGGQSEIVDIAASDMFLVREAATGLLKKLAGARVSRLPRMYISGLKLANNISDSANDMDIEPGVCRDDDDSADIVLESAMTKRLDALWTSGTNGGGRDTAAIADVFWHAYAIRNPSTSQCDVVFTQTYDNPTMPSGFTQKRRIGSFVRSAGVIRQQFASSDYVQYATPIADVAAGQLATGTGGPVGMGTSVPPGDRVFAHFLIVASNNTGSALLSIRTYDMTMNISTIAPQIANVTTVAELFAWTNSTGYLYVWAVAGGGITSFDIYTLGYYDHRGKES